MDEGRETHVLGEKYEKSMNSEERKKKGSFYTPYHIVDYIVKNIMYDLDVRKNPFIKVLDPSCGSGYFLIRAYEILIEKFSKNLKFIRENFKNENYKIKDKYGIRYVKGTEYWQYSNLSYHVLTKCIYGADIDEFAVKLAKINLCNKSGADIGLEHNIICCNSLIKWEKGHGKKQCCGLKPEEISEFWERKYDCILGNPPWISLSRKYKKNIENYLVDYYVENYGGNTYLPNLYEYFIKRSMELLTPHGRFGFIVPDRLASNLCYRDFRRSLLENYSILNLTFGIKFPRVNADSMIIIVENNARKHNRVNIDICEKRVYTVSQQQYLGNLNFEFSHCCSSNSLFLKKHIEESSKKLSDICSTFTGFIGCSAKITLNRASCRQIEVLKGENVGKFKISGNFYYDFIPENIKGGTKDMKKLARKNKIIIRKTGKNLIAALDPRGYIIEQSLYGIICKNRDFTSLYILGILNSTLIQWYYLNFLITNINSTPQIKKYSLDQIPVHECGLREKSEVEKLVHKIICGNGEENLSEKKLDEFVFDLYNIDCKQRSFIVNEVKTAKKRGGNGM